MSRSGYVLLSPQELQSQLEVTAGQLDELRASWSRLPRDTYLRDGGSYRHRRHSCFTSGDGQLELAPHRAHWQPTDYNALHGGMERWFEPVETAVTSSIAWQRLLSTLAALFTAIRPVPRWFVEAHQFRIDTAQGIGRPTPEGAHRDGVDYVAVILIDRKRVRGGETRVFEAQGTAGVRFTMQEPWTALLLDDARVIHETTPIQADGTDGVRDTLVLTYREGGFQAPAPDNEGANLSGGSRGLSAAEDRG
ncbi:MAG TPA: 2OG-Fe dioxygenase family protein [Steroidobacteraceae bacterium]|jgi:hypothetical protein